MTDRHIVVTALLLIGVALTLLLGSVAASSSSYRDKWYSPKDFERGEWACLNVHGTR